MSRRARIVLAGIASLLILVAGGFVYLRGGSTPVPVDEAIERFRASTPMPSTAPDVKSDAEPRSMQPVARPVASQATDGSTGGGATAPGARPVVPEGVFVYQTNGYDQVDALGGSRHTYPDETTITVRHDGCGTIERWDALAERWDERESCRTPEGDRLKRTTSHHEFFRQADTRTLDCDGFTYPIGAEPGGTWEVHCQREDTAAVSRLSAVGYEDVVVDGQALRTLHVHADIEVSGEQTGGGQRDVWGSADTGLVLRERVTFQSESVQPAIGKVTYSEEYEIRLKSLEPRT